MAEPVKKYLSTLSLNKRDSRKKLTFESSVSNFDNILEEKDLPDDTNLVQSETFLEFYQKEKQFLDFFERKTEKPLRKNHKISKSFDLSVLACLSSNYDKQIKFSRTSIMEKSGTRLSLIPSSSPTEMRKSLKMNEKKSPLVFLKNGKHRVLQIIDPEFSEFLDSIFIREDHKKFVSKNCLALRIRRKSDVSFGGFCKKLTKVSSLLSHRERKIAVLNQLIMKGKSEYAFDRSKDKKMTQSNSFHKKVRKVIKNSRLQEINKELAALREVKSKQDVSDSNTELGLKKSCSIDIMTQSKQMEFQEEIKKIQEKINSEKREKNISNSEKVYGITAGIHGKSKTYNQLFKKNEIKMEDAQKKIIADEREKMITPQTLKKVGFNEKNKAKNEFNLTKEAKKDEYMLKDAVKLAISNSISTARVRKLFASYDNSLPSINQKTENNNNSVSSFSNSLVFQDSYKSDKLEEYRKFLLKQMEKKKNDIGKTLTSLTSRTSNEKPYFIKEEYIPIHKNRKKIKNFAKSLSSVKKIV